jgi:hypothetical protein
MSSNITGDILLFSCVRDCSFMHHNYLIGTASISEISLYAVHITAEDAKI